MRKKSKKQSSGDYHEMKKVLTVAQSMYIRYKSRFQVFPY